jgi:hypothetical protein
VADVRVVWPDGTGADLVQKVHRVGNHVIAGFSGSVRIAFALIERLKFELRTPISNAWDLDVIAATWLPRVLRDEYERARPTDDERSIGVHLLIGAVDDQLKTGLPDFVAKAFATSRMCRVSSPGFSIEWATRQRGMTIGSGATAYAAQIDSLLCQLPTMRSVTQSPEGVAAALTLTMTNIIESQPSAAVSPHLHAAAAVWGASGVQAMLVGSDAAARTFPQTATTYQEFLALCEHVGLPAGVAAQASTRASSSQRRRIMRADYVRRERKQ